MAKFSLTEILIAFDQLINTFIYIPQDGWGMADETISARLFRTHLQDFISDVPMNLVNMLFFSKDHCFQAWRSEIERKQLPNSYRRGNL